MSQQACFEVVVGVNGSGSSLHAVKWAAAEATSRGGILRLVHAAARPVVEPPQELDPDGDEDSEHDAELRVLEVACLVATTMSPGLVISTEILVGSPPQVLSAASRDADLLVLGDRGPGGCTGMLTGSVAAAVADLADCPVLVVRGRVAHSGPVVAGLDGSDTDSSVLSAAFDRATRARASLLAVYVHEITSPKEPARWGTPLAGAELAAAGALSAALAPFARSHPGIAVRQQVVTSSPTSSPTAALVSASAGAQLVIVGANSASAALRGLQQSTVCSDDLRHTHCPVEVVRGASAA